MNNEVDTQGGVEPAFPSAFPWECTSAGECLGARNERADEADEDGVEDDSTYEILQERLSGALLVWAETLEDARKAEAAYREWRSTETSFGNRADRRWTQKNNRTRGAANGTVEIRNEAIAYINSSLGVKTKDGRSVHFDDIINTLFRQEDSDEAVGAGLQAYFSLLDRLYVANNPTTPEEILPDQRLIRAYANVFIVEQIARVHVAACLLSNDKVLSDMFSPDELGDWDESSKIRREFAVFDVLRGDKHGLLPAFFRKRASSEAYDPADFLRDNHSSKNTRDFLAAYACGQMVLGVPACVENRLGICGRLFSEAHTKLPESVRREIDHHRTLSNEKGVKQLEAALAANQDVKRIFQVRQVIDKFPISDTRVRTKRSPSPNRTRLPSDQDFTTIPETNSESRNIRLYLSNELIGMGELDGERAASMVDLLMGQKPFVNYCAQYKSDQNLSEALRRSLAEIVKDGRNLFNPQIRKMTNKASILHTHTDGSMVQLHPYRFRPASKEGEEGSQVARKTRIYYWAGSRNGHQVIVIDRVAHKTAIEKQIARGAW